ncbi:hypothetical protein NXY40_21595 [Phocaeicola vulgatus]|nr:hypothetical protein [Phocaeicola vulgatus]
MGATSVELVASYSAINLTGDELIFSHCYIEKENVFSEGITQML